MTYPSGTSAAVTSRPAPARKSPVSRKPLLVLLAVLLLLVAVITGVALWNKHQADLRDKAAVSAIMCDTYGIC